MNISRQILLLALTGIAQGAHAAEAESAIPEPSVFIEQAAQFSRADIEAARLAMARSRDPGVQGFARRVLHDQAQLGEQLNTMATAKGIHLSPTLQSTSQAMLHEITATSGADFDLSYAQHVAMAQTRAVALFEAAVNSPDPETSAFARNSLPALRERQQLAAQLAGQGLKGDIPGGR